MGKVACLLCFSVNNKVYNIRDTHLKNAYEEISGIKIQTDLFLCYICCARLQKCYLLIKQALNVQESHQNGSNELSTCKIDNVSTDGDDVFAYHVTIKSEPVEESSGCLKHIKEENEVNFAVKEAEETILTETEHKTTQAEKSYTCDICDKKFNKLSHLNVHKLTHTRHKVHNCDICNKKYYEISKLLRHKQTHTADKPFRCDICNKCFYRSDNLKVHKRTHNGDKPYTCDVCDRKFHQKGHLNVHKLTHSGHKPYTCDICDKKFSQSGNLKAHKLKHFGEKVYTCDICDQSFKYKNVLKNHKMIHTDEKPYSCDICNKKYYRSTQLNVHKKKNHK